ncbi:hypothetical protein SO802_019642 [Lithocarpus litseifolius]|uniref:Protein GAMETE EXPRESSED 1 n=1 Tax=Lithocarpus litseifolius TaxID=425828 RepID=A0AAW2CTD0_9ROSI
MGHHRHLLLLLILTSCSTKCISWGWFSSSEETQFDEKAFVTTDNSGPAKFSMEVFNDQKGARLVESARTKLAGANSCWQNAYQNLFAGCSDIFAGDEKRSRFAWHLSDCFQKESGRLPFPPCDPKSAMAKCLKGLNEHAHKGPSIQATNREIDNLKNEAIEIEKGINKVGDAMFMKMKNLQIKADDIWNLTGISLDKQQKVIDGQSTALDGLQNLTKFQSQALEDSRNTLQQFAEYGHRQQEELLQGQEQLQRIHDLLMENTKSILAAQESFESKQANMFVALDKLFALHNAMLLESRLIKAFFVYCLSIFIIYIFTSTKQTYKVRPWLYIGLFATFVIEVAIFRLATNDNIEQSTWIINLVRSLFVLLASIQIIHAICTYRDYEVLNHQMLLTLIEQINGMQRNEELSWDMDSDVNWSSWIDTDLPEDVNNFEDTDYMLREEVGENSIMTTSIRRNYNFRHK